MSDYDKLILRLQKIQKLSYALNLLEWDQQVWMPEGSEAAHVESASLIATLIYEAMSDPELMEILDRLSDQSLGEDQVVVVREVRRDATRSQKLPEGHVEELASTTGGAFGAWRQAKQKNNFGSFEPFLAKIVELKRREAEYLGSGNHPYDTLLDCFEPGMTVEVLDRQLGELKEFLIGEVENRKGGERSIAFEGEISEQGLKSFNTRILREIGFNLEAGGFEKSEHPFSIKLHPRNVRLTTSYSSGNPLDVLGSTMHEAGHGMYDQGLPAEHYGTPLAEAVSHGIHESQSRMWENQVGKSRAFAEYLHPILAETFGRKYLLQDPGELYDHLNYVEPSLIRTEADEVTYNLHVIIRYELEKALIEGSLEVKQLPQTWNQKMFDYLGVEVANDSEGVLQDIHWSMGSFGYFPSYTLGNLYAAQLYHAATRELGGLEEGFAFGKFEPLLHWLRDNIHCHGRRYSPGQLLERATGERLNTQYLQDYLRAKLTIPVSQ